MTIQSWIATTALGFGLLGGCERRSETPPPAPSSTRAVDTSAPSSAAPDNTAVNKVDRNSGTKTPMDQSNSKSDIDITASIRRAIMEDKEMSTNAQNCKIITEGGVVTLRGPVNSQAEKDAIEAKAKAASGVTRVDNQLEVKTK
ncbi:MAG: BON domain-containing protein [Phycisphaerales bacterium]|nr:BON domain-containing protein [Phycisphaerales bacterium]